jgi:hypothetical protein
MAVNARASAEREPRSAARRAVWRRHTVPAAARRAADHAQIAKRFSAYVGAVRMEGGVIFSPWRISGGLGQDAAYQTGVILPRPLL